MIMIIIIIIFTDNAPCGIHTNDTCSYVLQKAQTARPVLLCIHTLSGLNKVALWACLLFATQLETGVTRQLLDVSIPIKLARFVPHG